MQYVDFFALINLFLIISYYRTAASEHGKYRGLVASASASDRGDPGVLIDAREVKFVGKIVIFIYDNINVVSDKTEHGLIFNVHLITQIIW